MANLGPNGFDATGIEPTTDFEVIPAGRYTAEITNSEMRPNSKQTGEYLWLEFTVLDGPFSGRKLWAQLNLDNPSQQAVEIAQRELSAICHAVGKLRVGDSIELHNIPMEISIKIKNDAEYGPQNVLRGFKEIDGAGQGSVSGGSPNWKKPAATTQNAAPAAPTGTAQAPPAASTPVVNSPVPPWKKR